MKPKKKKAVRRSKAVAPEKAEKPKVKKKKGRPSGYTPEIIKQILALAVKGPTEVEIAAILNIGYSTLMEWKTEHPDLAEALSAARRVADNSVVRALRQRALGYSHKAVKFFMTRGGDILTREYTEHYPPDTTACIFWLKNRDKEKWRDVQKLEHSGEVNGNVQVIVTLPSNGREVAAS